MKTLKITDSIISLSKNEKLVKISIDSNKPKCERNNFICCLDVSGSMDDTSTNDQNDLEASKFSRWDLVKHSVSTIVHSLKETDKIMLIVFSNNAQIVLPFEKMNENGKKKALEALENIEINGGTNLWDGLKVTIEEVIKQETLSKDENFFSLILTDGEPNQNPPRGILIEFIEKLKESPIKSTISTFGYGYSLESTLLEEISKYGYGNFAHIPDHVKKKKLFFHQNLFFIF